MALTWADWPTGVLETLRQGTVIPAHLLALDLSRRLDVRRQRVMRLYPELGDDDFVAANRERWLS
jgi:hypothetical protein